jgi:hypothetical protein
VLRRLVSQLGAPWHREATTGFNPPPGLYLPSLHISSSHSFPSQVFLRALNHADPIATFSPAAQLSLSGLEAWQTGLHFEVDSHHRSSFLHTACIPSARSLPPLDRSSSTFLGVAQCAQQQHSTGPVSCNTRVPAPADPIVRVQFMRRPTSRRAKASCAPASPPPTVPG